MATGGAISWPMALKLGEELGSMLMHDPLLALGPPVPGFCAACFLSVFYRLGSISATGCWPLLCLGKRVRACMVEVCTNY